MNDVNFNQKNPVNTVMPQKSFDFDAINQRVSMSAPEDLKSQLKSMPFDLLGVTKYTTGYIIKQAMGILFGVGFLLVAAFVYIFADGDSSSGPGGEYLEFVREILTASNIQFIGIGLMVLLVLIVSFLFKKKGKVKDYFVLSKQGIYVYSKGHMDLIMWDKLQPLVRVSGKGKDSTIVYKFKITMAEQIADAMNDLPTNMQNGRGLNIPLGRMTSFGGGRSFGPSLNRSYRTGVNRRSPRLFKLYGVEHPKEVLEVSNHYLHFR